MTVLLIFNHLNRPFWSAPRRRRLPRARCANAEALRAIFALMLCAARQALLCKPGIYSVRPCRELPCVALRVWHPMSQSLLWRSRNKQHTQLAHNQVPGLQFTCRYYSHSPLTHNQVLTHTHTHTHTHTTRTHHSKPNPRFASLPDVPPLQAALELADEYSLRPHPIWPNRSREIISSLVESGWATARQ